jgi:hypothetical protein
MDANDATGINFAGVYRNGACVPVPSCPNDGSGNPMVAKVYIVPVSLSGANDPGTNNVYPVTSFTAFASGAPSATPATCGTGNAPSLPCTAGSSSTGTWWRACLQVVTSKGTVQWDGTTAPFTEDMPAVMAITRCAVQNEPTGDPFNVFGP